MSKNIKPCPFCAGEVYVAKIEPRLYRPSCNHPYSVVCYNCDLFFGYDEDYGGEFDTETEAIEAWNKRVVTDTNDGSKERTAKVIEHDASVTDTDGYKYHRSEYLCGACKKKVLGGDEYCSHCGAKLDWSNDE